MRTVYLSFLAISFAGIFTLTASGPASSLPSLVPNVHTQNAGQLQKAGYRYRRHYYGYRRYGYRPYYRHYGYYLPYYGSYYGYGYRRPGIRFWFGY